MSNKIKLPPLEDIEKEIKEAARKHWLSTSGDQGELDFMAGAKFFLPYLQQAREEVKQLRHQLEKNTEAGLWYQEQMQMAFLRVSELREEVERLKKENEQLRK